MEDQVKMILGMFLKSLKEFDLGMSVTVEGDFIFNDRNTGQQVAVSKEGVEEYYNKI